MHKHQTHENTSDTIIDKQKASKFKKKNKQSIMGQSIPQNM